MTEVEQGHLELDYLEDNYLAGQKQLYSGLQINQIIKDTKPLGFQADQIIKTQTPLGVQVNQIVKTLKELGLQVEQVVKTSKTSGLQTKQVITSGVASLGAQASQIIYTDDYLGLQVDQIIGDKKELGFQIDQIIKDSKNLGIQVDQSIKTKTYLGFQTDQFIKTKKELGFQVDQQFSDASSGLGFQAEMRYSEEKITGIQTEQIINTMEASGIQIDQIIKTKKATGLEVIHDTVRHRICGQYLVGGYLEEAYLTFKICAEAGWQVNQIIKTETETGLQAEQIIKDSKKLGFQAEQIVNTETPTGIQVERIIEDETPTGVQTEQIIKTETPASFQIQQIVNAEIPLGFQAMMQKKHMLSFQTRMIIYNTSQLRLMWEFPSRGTEALLGENWSATSTAPGDFSVNNVNTDIVEQVYRSATGSHGYLEIICDTGLSQGVAFDTLGILNHNLTTSALVQVQGANEPTFSPPRFLFNMKVERQNMYYIAPTFPTSLGQNRYWKFIFQNYTNPDEFIEIGSILFGMSHIFSVSENFANPVISGYKHFKDEIPTEGFTRVTNDRTLKRFLRLPFENLNFHAGNSRALDDMMRFARTSLKVLVVPTPKDASRFAVFGKLTGLPDITTNYVEAKEEYMRLELEWDESL